MNRSLKIAVIILIIIAAIPLVAIGTSFIGRIAPDSVIPDTFEIYVSIPNPASLANHVLEHKHLADILALAELAPLLPALNDLIQAELTGNRVFRRLARGRLDAAILPEGRILVAWDTGILSPFLRTMPVLIRGLRIPNLYHVQARGNNRFEYRLDDGTVFFVGQHRNLLIISNNAPLYNSVLSGDFDFEDKFAVIAQKYHTDDFDIGFLIAPETFVNLLTNNAADDSGSGAASNELIGAFNLLDFPGPIKASLAVLPDQLRFRFASLLETDNPALQAIIQRNSQATPLEAMIPASAQYLTLLSAGTLQELLNAASAIAHASGGGADWDGAIRSADRSARLALGMDLEELLFSWSGTQFAVYGLEGRPNPVIAIEIKDEQKRTEVFNRAFRSLFVSENIQLTLDGHRIPRIQLPGFLNTFLRFMNIHVPSPFYIVHNNYLLVSESAETLLAAVNAIRRNEVLPRTEVWRTLSDISGPASISLYYSLDRSLPFFLTADNTLTSVLRLYRQGLLRIHLHNGLMTVNLHVIPGGVSGVVPVPGFPIDLMGVNRVRTNNRLYRVASGANTRLILTRGNDVLAVNPFNRTITEMSFPGSPGASLYAIPAKTGDGIWVVNSRGHVSLVNTRLENLRGFPVSTGINLSAPPAVWGDRVFLSCESGSVYTVDSRSSIRTWGNTFFAPLRSPPSFISFRNRTFAAVYLRSFFGEIFLLDENGNTLPHWPVSVSGIAYGSPLPFISRDAGAQERLLVAFITQAGELAVYTETAQMLPGFPIQLAGVFFLQPVFDGQRLWIIESSGILYSIGLNGEVLRERIPRLNVMEEGYITIADVTHDSFGLEIFFTGDGNALHGYSRDFRALEGFPLPAWGRPVFGDLDGDGRMDIAGISMDSRLYMWRVR